MWKSRNVRLLFGVALLQGMVFYGPVATLYRQAVGVGLFEITLIESISLALCLVLELPWGVAAERIGYRKTMIVCCGLYALSKVVFWRAEGFGAFLLERVMLSVVIAGMSGVDTAMLYLSCPAKERQRCYGWYNALSTAGMMIASVVYGVFVGSDYRMAALLTVFSYGAAAVLALFLQEVRRDPSPKPPAQAFKQALGQLLHGGALPMLLLATALLAESNQTISVFLCQIKYEQTGLSTGMIAAACLLVTAAGLPTGWSARLSGKLGQGRSGVMLCIGGCIGCVVLMLTGNGLVAIAAVMLLRFCSAMMSPLSTALQNDLVQGDDRATALSVNAVVMDALAVMTNLLFGYLADVRLNAALLLGAGFCMAAAVLFGCFARRMANFHQ